jgi:hypothetical protein
LSLLLAGPALADDVRDTIMLANGGRIRGTVMEEDPKAGVLIRLPDGTTKRIPDREVNEVVYGGATPQRAAPAQQRAVPSAEASGTEGTTQQERRAAEKKESPVHAYQNGTFSLLAGTGYSATGAGGGFLSGGGAPQGFVQMGIDTRLTFEPGFVLNARVGLLHPTGGKSTNIGPGVGVGAVLPISDWAAFVPMLDLNIAFDSKASGVGFLPSGTLAVDLFAGRHGFVELYVSGGAIFDSSGGPVGGLMVGGYRLGVMF